MSIRQSLLAILELGPCYGYQLRLEFERRTAAPSPLNVGQVYATLERLERDGLVSKLAPDSAGHVYYEITDAGRSASRAWLAEPVAPPARDDLAAKLALALTLPEADPAALIAAQRALTTAALAEQREGRPDHEGRPDREGRPHHEHRPDHEGRPHQEHHPGSQTLAERLVGDALALAAEAQLRWLDRCEALLVEALPYGLEAERPRRGRPVTLGLP